MTRSGSVRTPMRGEPPTFGRRLLAWAVEDPLGIVVATTFVASYFLRSGIMLGTGNFDASILVAPLFLYRLPHYLTVAAITLVGLIGVVAFAVNLAVNLSAREPRFNAVATACAGTVIPLVTWMICDVEFALRD